MLHCLATTSTAGLALNRVDIAVVASYLAVMLGIGVWVGRGQRSTKDYFLGDRSLPWWAVLLSIVATETSTVTFLSIPGMAFAAGGDLRFLQITFGYIVGRILVVLILLPLYFRGEPYTAYEVLQRRFGKLSRRATSLLFLVTRNLSDGLRLYLSALVLQTAMGIPLGWSVVIMGLVTVVYTYIGGVKSVIWNDCVQFVIYVLGACLAFKHIIDGLPGGWEQFTSFGKANGKFLIFDFTWGLFTPTMTFWAGLIGGAFLTGATHGTDQLTVQRLLTARSQTGAAVALIVSGFVVCLQFALFLLIGAGLAAFFAENPTQAGAIKTNDHAFAYFIVHYLPTGLVGLTLAAVFSAAMSTLSGSLNSSATAMVSDFIIPLRREPLSESAQLRLSRIVTGLFGVLQIGIALATYWRGADELVVNRVLKIAAFTSGPMLGLYLLGVLGLRVRERAALAGFSLGLVLLSYLEFSTWSEWPWQSLRWQKLGESDWPPIYWPWYAAIGSIFTFTAGWLLSWTPLNAASSDQANDE
jgi:solute:Na+ symporter, SSS family